MPTYEYECLKCKRSFEYFQKMSDDALETCIFEGCNGKVKRLVSGGSGLIFKGSGFYETDYKKKSQPACSAAKSEGCPNSKACAAASNKGD